MDKQINCIFYIVVKEEATEMGDLIKRIEKEQEEIKNEYKLLNKVLPEPKFSEGDIVIVKDDWFEFYNNKVGEVSLDIQLRRTLDDERGITYVYRVYFEGENGELPIQENSLQLYNN